MQNGSGVSPSAKSVILKQGKEKAVRNRHHWIFSGAVGSLPEFEDGDILPVQTFSGEVLGHAYFNKKCSIIGRMISFGGGDYKKAVIESIRNAVNFRKSLYNHNTTNAFRIINAEGDCLPGLIADYYNGTIVIQVSTLGMEKLKPLILDTLSELLSPSCIIEKSKLSSRKEEGLQDKEGVLSGKLEEPLAIIENGIKFVVNFTGAQKTSFYLDQREMRKLVMDFSKGRKVLNCFSYTGSFSVYALKGGAGRVDSVDESEEAIALAKENIHINNLSKPDNKFYIADVFQFLRSISDSYDLIILDPPAFAKKKKDIPGAARGYKDINRIAMQHLNSGSYLMTFSCSYFIDEELFQKIIFQAARESGRLVRIIQRHHHAYDHPVNVYHPETNYLKGLLLYVE